MTPQEKAEKQRLWKAIPPEMQQHLKMLGQTFGKLNLVYLEVDGKVLKNARQK